MLIEITITPVWRNIFRNSHAFAIFILNFVFFFRFNSIRISLSKFIQFRPPIMTTIKLFCNVHKYFKAMGFYAPSQPNVYCPVNRKNVFHMFAVTGSIIPPSGFLIFKAQSVYEYSNTFYVTVAMTTITVEYIVYFCKMRSIINLIEHFQDFIEKRKCGF